MFTPTPAMIESGQRNRLSLTKKYPIWERTITKIAKPLSSCVLSRESDPESLPLLIIRTKAKNKKALNISVCETGLFIDIIINYLPPKRVAACRGMKEITGIMIP